jgi:hypothetical protein
VRATPCPRDSRGATSLDTTCSRPAHRAQCPRTRRATGSAVREFAPTETDWTVNLSTGTGFNFRTWAGAAAASTDVQVGDLDGDGNDDVFTWRNSRFDWPVNLSTGSGLIADTW